MLGRDYWQNASAIQTPAGLAVHARNLCSLFVLSALIAFGIGILSAARQLPAWADRFGHWIALVPFLAFIAHRIYRIIASVALQRDLVALINSHKLPEAWAMADLLEARTGGALPQSFYDSIRGAVLLANGQLADGLAVAQRCLQRNDMKSQAYAESRAINKYNMSIGHALLGQYDAAEAMLESARADMTALQAKRLVLAEAIIALRQGRPDAALKRINEDWSAFEGVGTSNEIKSLRVLRALAARTVGKIDCAEALAGCRPFTPGEFYYLGVEWPEMRTFLEEHGFSEKDAGAGG